MIHLSSYHSNGLPTVVWSNKVNLIGEKVYKPKIHFCEYCNKPILIYGRLIPCKHVFCFSCATLCLHQGSQSNNHTSTVALTPPAPGMSEPTPKSNQSPLLYHQHHNQQSPHHNNDRHYHHNKHSRGRSGSSSNNNHNSSTINSKNLDLHRSDSNHSFSHKDNSGSLLNLDESTSNTTPTTIQQETTANSPSLNGANIAQPPLPSQGCHRCGGRALRVERNTLNSIFVCQVDSCRRTYLSARDLQAHVTHRHSRNKSGGSNNNGAPSASMQAISSSPYISSSTLQLLNNSHNHQQGNSNNNNHRQSASSSSTVNNNNNSNNNNNNNSSPIDNHNRRDRSSNHNQNHHNQNHNQRHGGGRERKDRDRSRDRERMRERDRERYNRNRDNYRDRERDRDSKEYHRQSLQRAAQWAEASAQMLEKGLSR